MQVVYVLFRMGLAIRELNCRLWPLPPGTKRRRGLVPRYHLRGLLDILGRKKGEETHVVERAVLVEDCCTGCAWDSKWHFEQVGRVQDNEVMKINIEWVGGGHK